MEGSPKALPLRNSALCTLRMALGAALFAALLMVLGSSGAFASSGSDPTAAPVSQPPPDKGQGFLSGILNPIADIVDQAVSRAPVVPDIAGSNTVGKVVAPVAAATDNVENTVAKVTVVGPVAMGAVAPVHNVVNAVVPPGARIVEKVTAPGLETVSRVTAPVVHIVSPVLDPVTDSVQTVVGGVTGGVVDVVENVVLPAVPSLPGTPAAPSGPGTPGIPGIPLTPGVVLPAFPGGGGDVVESVPGLVPASAGDAAAVNGVATDVAKLQAAVNAPVGPVDSGPLARYLGAAQDPGATSHIGAAAAAISQEGAVSATCSSEPSATAVGPCAPAVAPIPATGTSNSITLGSAGGNAGPVAADANAGAPFALAKVGESMPGADWPVPAALPENPGSTPG